MLTLPAELLSLIVEFAPLFSKSVWERAKVLLVGVVLAPGKRTRPKKTGGDRVKFSKISACPNLLNQTSINSQSSCLGSARLFGDAYSSEAIQPSPIYMTPYKSHLAGPTTIVIASLIHGKQYGVAYLGGITFRDAPRRIKLSDLGLRVKEKFLYEYDFNDQWRHLIRVEAILPSEPDQRYPVCISGSGRRRPKTVEALGLLWSVGTMRLAKSGNDFGV